MIQNIQFSKHFDLYQLIASNTATRENIEEQFNPPTYVVNNLRMLVLNVLEPIRDLINAPVIDSSGYRCRNLNTKVGGEWNSQHLSGEAADITAEGYTVEKLYETIKASKINFDELIIENNGKGVFWVHVSYDPNKIEQRGICMKGVLQEGGGTICVADGFGNFKTANV